VASRPEAKILVKPTALRCGLGRFVYQLSELILLSWFPAEVNPNAHL
jgi:hypothetical protein